MPITRMCGSVETDRTVTEKSASHCQLECLAHVGCGWDPEVGGDRSWEVGIAPVNFRIVRYPSEPENMAAAFLPTAHANGCLGPPP